MKYPPIMSLLCFVAMVQLTRLFCCTLNLHFLRSSLMHTITNTHANFSEPCFFFSPIMHYCCKSANMQVAILLTDIAEIRTEAYCGHEMTRKNPGPVHGVRWKSAVTPLVLLTFFTLWSNENGLMEVATHIKKKTNYLTLEQEKEKQISDEKEE